jgi:MFS family permease
MKSRSPSTPKPAFFYGYVIVAAALLSMAVSSGAIFSFSVFFAPLQEQFGWSRAVTSSAFSVNMVVQGVLSIGVGRLNDRFGPRIILTASGLFLGLGFILGSRIDSIWQLYLLYGVVIGVGVSGGPVPMMSTVARWFRERRGMMTGIVMAGVGFGTMIMPPFAEWLIRTVQWRSSFVVVGLLLMVVIPFAAHFLRRDPAQMGLQPLGRNEAIDVTHMPLTAPGLPFSRAVHTRQLWLLVVAFAGFGFAVHSVMVHVVIDATGLGLSSASAAGIMTAIGALGVVGRVGLGSLADKLGAKRLLVAAFLLLSLSLFGLATAGSAWFIYGAAFLFGFAFGGIVPLNSHIVAELFGLRAHGAVLGVIGFTIGLGSAIGPVFTGYCYDLLGSYTFPFLCCGSVAAASALLISLVKPLAGRAQQVAFPAPRSPTPGD